MGERQTASAGGEPWGGGQSGRSLKLKRRRLAESKRKGIVAKKKKCDGKLLPEQL